ncbi:MAG: RecX family transcriptional regulator [Clostridia bacterium]|nr:RecX family transcriptional regulator [Clostridia bacterium]
MGLITAITAQVKDKTRCSVFIDGRFVCGLALETVMKNRLKVGKQITLEEMSAIQLEGEKDKAFDKALYYISASQKTEKQVSDYLSGKGYLPEVVEYVLEKLKGYSFVNDESYAKAYASDALKRKGSRLVKRELAQKGVEESQIQQALCSVEDRREEEGCQRLAEKYLKNKETDRQTLQKAFRYLMSKGYDYDMIKSVLSLLTDTEIEDE